MLLNVQEVALQSYHIICTQTSRRPTNAELGTLYAHKPVEDQPMAELETLHADKPVANQPMAKLVTLYANQ